jgi:glycosyltransferase involved in cell wall biosynthesis
MPKVSIILPIYNSAQFIEEALESIRQQTFQDYEVLVVDDGSGDQTGEIVKRHKDRLRYIYQEHGGPAKARNRGIRESTGKYVAFLDSDDLWLPTKLEKQVDMMDRNPELGMVITENLCFNERGVFMPSMGKRKRLMGGDVAKNIFVHSWVGTPTVMVKREVFDRVGLFEEQLQLAEDDNMWVRIAVNFKVGLLDEVLVKVRDHPSRTILDREKMFESVRANIELLSHKYAGIRERIQSAIPLKYSRLYFEMGYFSFENQNYPEARAAFQQGIKSYGWYWKNYVYFLLCCLPKRLIRKLKHIKSNTFGLMALV